MPDTNDDNVKTKSGAPPAAEEARPSQRPAAASESSKDASKDEKPAEAAAPPPSQPAVDELAAAKAETQRFREQWMRSAADFDNFRKRARRDVEDARKAGKEDFLKELLPVFDNLERAINSAQRATEVKAVADGLVMIMRQFGDTLSRQGITKVPTTGQEFDPTVHEAIQQVESDEHTPGTVVSEVQPGYMQGDRLVRAAMVVVAKPKAKPAGEANGKAEGEGNGTAGDG